MTWRKKLEGPELRDVQNRACCNLMRGLELLKRYGHEQADHVALGRTLSQQEERIHEFIRKEAQNIALGRRPYAD